MVTARDDPEWATAPARTHDPRPGARDLEHTVLAVLGIELLAGDERTFEARLTPGAGARVTPGELLVLAETVASTAAGSTAGPDRRAFGAELNATFVARPVPGPVRATATALRTTDVLHSWRITAEDREGRPVLDGRCTLAITQRP